MTRISLCLALGLAACSPQTASIEDGDGEYIAYLASSTSQTLFEDTIDFDVAETAFNIDCRELDDESDRLSSPLDICGRRWDRAHESWIGNDAYRVVGGALTPWRGEAIITSEGDVQIGFHQRLPGGQDFRFSFVIDPNFQPQRCSENSDGETVAVDIDGDWVEEWSKDEENGIVYYLTSGAFQFNPGETEDIWSLPQEWRSGSATGHFGAEDLSVRRPYYAVPAAYAGIANETGVAIPESALFFSGMEEGDDPTTDGGHQGVIRTVEDIVEETNDEFLDIQAPILSRVHTNEWRMPDGSAAGLDSWVGLHYSWIHFDEGTVFEQGGSFSGEFQLLFDATESQTRVVANGRFTVNNLKKDRWVTDDVTAAKLEESGTVLCTQ